MIELWKRHVAWRFARHAQPQMAAEEAPERPINGIIGHSGDGGCARCGKPREDATNVDPKPITVVFTDEEIRRIHQFAEWYVAWCDAYGQPIPPDPMRALLGAANQMAWERLVIAAVIEREQWQADGGVVH